ncbi:MAG: ferrous iron transport protein B [Limnohabitans sp.]|nr:ferrous iron transport protein B [Limnohabitans sp.]
MKNVALVGMPNTGKSTLFNRLTGAHAKVGNWPGITVDLYAAKLLMGNQIVQLVDLPGVYDLRGYSEDEQVVTTFLGQSRPDLIIVVMNATQLDRQTTLLSELMAFGIPLLAVLSMADEAKSMGITVDEDGLRQALGCPVCLLSAKYGQGVEHLQGAIRQALQSTTPDVTPLTPPQLSAIFERHTQTPAQATHQLTERLDRVLLHPVLGLPIFFSVMLLVFQAVFVLGKPLQDGMSWLFSEGRSQFLEPWLSAWPPLLQGLLLDGLYNGLGTVASFVPLIVLFFAFLGLIEDSGYLSRAAFLMDALMARFGLDGRSFVMLLMGFGCNVPALMGTRVIRSRGLRLLTMLTIPFSLCSARLQVFVFFTAALFTTAQAPWVLFSLYVISILASVFTALIFKRQYVNNEPFVLEMPPYRFPTWRQVALRGWQEVHHFLHRATRFIMLGVILVWVLTHLPVGVEPGSLDSWAGLIGRWLDPLLSPLGIDPRLTIALLFGFVAKEIVIGSLAVIYGLEGQGLVQALAQQIHWTQAYSFMLFALIYTPCVSAIATIQAESRNWRFTTLSVVWPLVLAWCTSWVFYRLANSVWGSA